MVELEKKTDDARMEMAVADALDDIRERNALRNRADVDTALAGVAAPSKDEERERFEREDEEAARRAFLSGTGEKVRRLDEDIELAEGVGLEDDVKRVDSTRTSEDIPPPPVPTFARKAKEKKAPALLSGIKKKPVAALVSYDSDEDD
jgi:hypothetical protein